jgi:hypothetical protein
LGPVSGIWEARQVLEALAEELCGNEQLRAFVAGMVAD